MQIPVIFFHYGDPLYLKYALKQARYYNPDADIYLLGDKENNKYPFVTHISIAAFEPATEQFRSIYQHRSDNDLNYELICFLRWFYIREFCKANDIDSFIYLDSDVLCYQNLTELVPLFNNCRIANTCDDTGMPAFTYFRDKGVINDFCDHLIRYYTDPAAIARLDYLYQPFKDNPQLLGGISDMALFHLYFKDYPEGAIKVDLLTDEIAVDSNINCADGYETENGIKKIYWKNNLPYGKNEASGKLIRFVTLHYQAHAKDAMRQNYTAEGYQVAKYLEARDIKGKIKRAKKSIKKYLKGQVKIRPLSIFLPWIYL
ncbi:hypothetical protein [Mucilaginibacter panaciglaebae]|uniref:Glycosyl transferase family 8 n=1 Tax=Mucilaginibacter panaciglaebae TaxID=502331 RepID=A0ABP7WV25_9SPHI